MVQSVSFVLFVVDFEQRGFEHLYLDSFIGLVFMVQLEVFCPLYLFISKKFGNLIYIMTESKLSEMLLPKPRIRRFSDSVNEPLVKTNRLRQFIQVVKLLANQIVGQ